MDQNVFCAHKTMSHSEAGMTLTSTLVALLLSSIIGLTFATLMKDMFFGIQRVTNQSDAQAVVRLVTATLTNPDTCGRALREGAVGAHSAFTLPPPGAPKIEEKAIGLIISKPNATAEGDIIVGDDNPVNRLNRVLTVRRIFFNELDPAARRTITTLNEDAVPVPKLRTYVGKVVLQFNTDSVFGGGLDEKTIPVCLATSPTTGEVVACCSSASAQKLCEDLGGKLDAQENCVFGLNGEGVGLGFQCNGTTAESSDNDDCATVPAGCTRLYYIDGLLANLRPRCRCRVVCT